MAGKQYDKITVFLSIWTILAWPQLQTVWGAGRVEEEDKEPFKIQMVPNQTFLWTWESVPRSCDLSRVWCDGKWGHLEAPKENHSSWVWWQWPHKAARDHTCSSKGMSLRNSIHHSWHLLLREGEGVTVNSVCSRHQTDTKCKVWFHRLPESDPGQCFPSLTQQLATYNSIHARHSGTHAH